jgi:hypothetical protein
MLRGDLDSINYQYMTEESEFNKLHQNNEEEEI